MSSRIHVLTRRGTAALSPVLLLGQFSLALALPSAPLVLPHGSTTSSPVVSMVSPDHAPISGTSGVVITGSSFAGATQVLFGPNAVSFTVDSDSQITASLFSVSTTGWVDVSVTTPCGTGTLVHAFDYFQPPTKRGFGACIALDWSGSPTLGQSYTITAYPPGPGTTTLRVRWSVGGSNGPSVSYFSSLGRFALCGAFLFRQMQSVPLVGSPPSHTFVIPSDVSLIGVHLQTQASFVYALQSPPHPRLSPMLDAVIGE